MSTPPQLRDWPASLPTPWGPYRAVVGEVYDGDTPRFWVSLGLDHYAWIDIRLADVRAPEMNDPDPPTREAAQRARDVLVKLIPPGARVRIRTERVEGSSEHRSFTRYVGWVTADDGLDVNAEMVAWLDRNGYTGGE